MKLWASCSMYEGGWLNARNLRCYISEAGLQSRATKALASLW
jgi:hypothetical protein